MKKIAMILLAALMLFSACGTATEIEPSQGGEETEAPATVSSEDHTAPGFIPPQEEGPYRDELLEEAFKKEESDAEYAALEAATVDIEGVYPDFSAESSIHEVTILLPAGWTIQHKQEPIQSDCICDHYISEDSQAAFYVYDEQGKLCAVLGLDKYSDIEDGVFNFYYGNNLHFADDNPNVTASRTDDFETHIAVVEHWSNDEGVMYNDGIFMKNVNTGMTIAMEIDLNRIPDVQLKEIAEQFKLS